MCWELSQITLFVTPKMTFQGKHYYPRSTRRKLRWAGDVARAPGLGLGGAIIPTRPCLTQSPGLAPEQTALHAPGFRPHRLLAGDGGLSFAFGSPHTLAPCLARGRWSVMTMNGTFGGLNPFHVLLGGGELPFIRRGPHHSCGTQTTVSVRWTSCAPRF